jgi:hypothetical protein
MRQHLPGEENEFFYMPDGRRRSLGLVRKDGTIAERYRFDAWNQPSIIRSDKTPLGNPILADGLLWDDAAGLYFRQSKGIDPESGSVLNPGSMVAHHFVRADGGTRNIFSSPPAHPMSDGDSKLKFILWVAGAIKVGAKYVELLAAETDILTKVGAAKWVGLWMESFILGAGTVLLWSSPIAPEPKSPQQNSGDSRGDVNTDSNPHIDGERPGGTIWGWDGSGTIPRPGGSKNDGGDSEMKAWISNDDGQTFTPLPEHAGNSSDNDRSGSGDNKDSAGAGSNESSGDNMDWYWNATDSEGYPVPDSDNPLEGGRPVPPGMRLIGPGVAAGGGDSTDELGDSGSGLVWVTGLPGLRFRGGFIDPSPDALGKDSGGVIGGAMRFGGGFTDPSPDDFNLGWGGEALKFVSGFTDPVPDQALMLTGLASLRVR